MIHAPPHPLNNTKTEPNYIQARIHQNHCYTQILKPIIMIIIQVL